MNALTKALETADPALMAELEALYKDLHQHPELSMQEVRTAKIVADSMQNLGYEVTRNVGITGVVCVLKNGAAPTVMLRADMDALPMSENTGLPYASTVKTRDADVIEVGVSHSCGHDMHVTWMLGAARILSTNRAAWQGTLMVVFQPGEETAEGANAMVRDWDKGNFPKPDVILGQHVMVGAAGTVSYRPGVTLSAGGQPQDQALRAWLARLTAPDLNRPGHHGCSDHASLANHRFTRNRPFRAGGANHWLTASWHQGKYHS